MATAILDAPHLREILDYDRTDGVFTWKVMLAHRRKPGDAAGSVTHGYIEIGIDNRSYRAHRLAWMYVYGDWPSGMIDHIDGNRENNAIANLRVVTNKKNAQNRHWVSMAKTTSDYLGVTWNAANKCWLAQIKGNDGNVYLGQYGSEHEAHIAYLHAKRELHDDADIASKELPTLPARLDRRRRSSAVNGVSYDRARGKWCAKPLVNGKRKHIGYFPTEQEAISVCATTLPPSVQQNTSPAFPPVPQQAGGGMTGIETPTTTDNLQGEIA